jgi:NIMA (never in mitosis gene a)-related kinase
MRGHGKSILSVACGGYYNAVMTCQDHFTKFCSERYRYEKLLGEGASGRAMLVSCRQDNTQWVVKEIDVKGMLLDEVQNCLKEAKLLEALNHPNIIKFREIYQTKEQKLHIVMEYADSGTLASFIKEA